MVFNILLALLLFFNFTYAATPVPVKVDVAVQKVEIHNKIEKLISNPKWNKGDVIQYIITYTNNTKSTLNNINVDFQIPDGLRWNGQVNPLPDKAALINSKLHKYPLIDTKNKLITLEYYKHLQWNIKSLKPGKPYTIMIRLQS